MDDEGACALPTMDISDEEEKEKYILGILEKVVNDGKLGYYLNKHEKEKHILDILKMLINEGKLEYYLNILGCKYERSEEIDESATHCGHCMTSVTDNGVNCNICKTWYHLEDDCSNINDNSGRLLDSDYIWYVCKNCKNFDGSKLGNMINTKAIEDNLETLKTNIEVMTMMLQDIAQKIVKVDRDMKLESKKEKSYAETLKTKKVLLIKSTSNEGEQQMKRNLL